MSVPHFRELLQVNTTPCLQYASGTFFLGAKCYQVSPPGLYQQLRPKIPMNQLLSGYRAFLAASIHGRTTSKFSEAHRLAPASGSSSAFITDSRSLICLSVSSSASMNA